MTIEIHLTTEETQRIIDAVHKDIPKLIRWWEEDGWPAELTLAAIKRLVEHLAPV